MTRCKPAFFDPDWYLRCYPDVAASGMDPLRHYLRHGRREGRLPCAVFAATRERDRRLGLLEAGPRDLRALAAHGAPAERAWARIAQARAAARHGDWAEAEALLRPLDPETELIGGFCLPDPALLATEAALIAGDRDRAGTLLRIARHLLGSSPDLHLAAANLAAARAGHGPGWRWRMQMLFAHAGLGGVRVAVGEAPAFDRLHRAGPALPRRGGPLVSVLMPARDAEATIGTALRSLRDQSWQALEILVIDNGSRDDTAAIVRRHAAGDPRIRLLDGSAEPGAYPARNIGLAAARGAFVTVLDADDWAHPARIARQAGALLRAPDRMASVSHWVRATPDLRFTRWWGDTGYVHRNISSLMIRAELRDTLGYWDRVRAGADTEYHERILAQHGSEAIAEVSPGLPLSFGRSHPGSLTRNSETGLHSQHAGPRHDYRMAARRWHHRMREDGALPLPRLPDRRPFPAPTALALTDTAAEETALPPQFDADWYLRSYPDLRARDLEPWSHYRDHGAAEGRDPGPDFSTTGYRMAQGLQEVDGPPLAHYLRVGAAAGADPTPVFAGDLPPPAPGKALLFFGHQARARIFGAERSLLDVLDRAVAAGFTPSLVLPNLENESYLAALRPRLHRLHVLPFGWLFGGVAPHPRTLERLTRLIRDSGAVELHQNTLVLDAPLRAARAAGVPTVVHVRELPAQDPRLCLDLGLGPAELRTYMLELADRFIANSQAVIDWLDLPATRVTLLPNRVDAALAKLPFAPQGRLRVALIGSLTARKGVADAVAIARACASLPAEFLLIGPDSTDLAALGPLPRNMRHAGYCPDPATALAQADIVLSLSHFAESFGRTVLEALTAGRPVICYDLGTPPALLGDSGAGQVVPAGDIAAAARALRDLITAPDRLRAMSQAARARGAALQEQAAGISNANLFARPSTTR
ncbi:glycosyltransferase [Ruegeria pomeroyi]|uniref:Glycosyltransferase n=1 Tax=Ruegeria pomeroyi TaxID=89184 RepID=A0A9Q3WPW6_9RHOB|nr:glycosyltransferase [Ruegeria pomeroyi]MCE8540156.1 glycosyltransferase [Ruegeria pomeroyi]